MMNTITQMQGAEKRHSDQFERLMLAYADLTRKLSPEPPSLPERTRDEVIDAIIAKSGSNGQLRAHLASWAMSQRRQKVDDDEIIKGILVWTDSEQDQAE